MKKRKGGKRGFGEVTFMTSSSTKDKNNPQWGGIALISFGPIGFGIRSLHAYLKAKGIRTYIIFLPLSERERLTKKGETGFCDLLKELDVRLVGFSVVSPLFQMADYLTRLIRQEINVPIIWGGAYPTLCPEESSEVADIVCLGEGEEALTELAASLQKSEDFTSISNLWVRSGNRIWKNSLRPLFSDVDRLPFQDIRSEDKYVLRDNKLVPGDPIRKSRMYVVRVARGCAFSCGYCSNHALREVSPDKKKFFRRRSPENVIQELKMAVQEIRGLKIIKIDEVFPFIQDPWLEEFVHRYQKEIGLPMEIEWHPGAFDFEVVSMLVKAGLKRLVIGIESGSEDIRSRIFMRRGTNEHLLEITGYLKSQDVQLRYNFILDNPFENDDDRKETFELIMELPRPHILNLYNLRFYPKTKATEIALENGLIKPHEIEGKGRLENLRWKSVLDKPRFDKDRYYASLIFFASKKYIPRVFLKIFYRVKFFRNHTAPLTWWAKGLATLQRLKAIIRRSAISHRSRY